MTADAPLETDNTDHARSIRRRWIVAVILVASAAGLLAMFNRGPGVVPPAPLAVFPTLPADAAPRLIVCEQLPPLAGYMSPKPVVAADQQGQVVVLAHGTTNSPLGSDIVAWRSSSGGRSWQPPQNLTNVAKAGRIEFDPWLESDRRGSFYSVYVHDGRGLGDPVMRRSDDGGQSWTEDKPLPWKGADRPVLGISPNGTRLVIAASMSELTSSATTEPLDPKAPDFAEQVRARFRSYPGVFVSTDQGQRWARTESPFGDNIQAIPFAAVVDDHGLIAVTWIVGGAGSSSAVSVSHDNGNSWQATVLVKPLQADRDHPFNGERFPVVASSAGRKLHVAYIDPTVPALEYQGSDDGTTWSQPRALSAESADEIRMAAIDAIGPMVHVTWMERTGSVWQAWYRGSRDFGATWSEPLCLSNAMTLSDGTTASGFSIHSDDDQSSVRDDGLGRIHAVWCIRGGHVVHAVMEWTRLPH